MNILIVRCSNGGWYRERVGEIFDSVRFERNIDPSQGIPADVHWCRTGDTYNTLNYIVASDIVPAPLVFCPKTNTTFNLSEARAALRGLASCGTELNAKLWTLCEDGTVNRMQGPFTFAAAVSALEVYTDWLLTQAEPCKA